MLTAGVGALASIPLVMRVLLPRWTARLRRAAGRLLRPPPMTQLQLERSQPTPGPEDGQLGFTVDEMTAIVERLLRDVGLTSNYARLVVVAGHGSTSLNNPHKSAYDCGACGGGAGGPNARALAQMANDPRVRARLQDRGLVLPPETVFVGALHNTCDDSLTFYDLDRLPRSHQARIRAGPARDGRCLRPQCPRTLPAFRLRSAEHVVPRRRGGMWRAAREDLAQTRPECGHATNAVCIVGRRERTRGLFLDRRAFLVSYDPHAGRRRAGDSDAHPAGRRARVRRNQPGVLLLLRRQRRLGLRHQAATQYHLAAGRHGRRRQRLAPGLPWQMVEIHEPVRLLFIIETTPEAMLRIMERQRGHWQAVPQRLGATHDAQSLVVRRSTSSGTGGSSRISRRRASCPRSHPPSIGTAAGATI